MECGACDIEPAWCVNGQLPIDKVLVTFTLQHWNTQKKGRKTFEGMWQSEQIHAIISPKAITAVKEGRVCYGLHSFINENYISESILVSYQHYVNLDS